MPEGWMIAAAAGVFTGIWSFQPDRKFLKYLPKISRNKGLVATGALFLLAYYLKRQEEEFEPEDYKMPPKIPKAESGYVPPHWPTREPLGYLSGPGRDQLRAEVPASSILYFPYMK